MLFMSSGVLKNIYQLSYNARSCMFFHIYQILNREKQNDHNHMIVFLLWKNQRNRNQYFTKYLMNISPKG